MSKRLEEMYQKAIAYNEVALEYSFKKHQCKRCRKVFVPRLCKDVDICPKCEGKAINVEQEDNKNLDDWRCFKVNGKLGA
ncbi:MAG: hypothetical protein PHF86_15125 [Candidatus Nanoarchaeia archaeon]|jgi:Zn finger protein HypA/HybF involved in hydrogenase expression|nr:hypothetical protein [Candidatus Nanoarchaeia archaeon]